ncbi:MAG: hypothetical protein K8R23_19765 [Chthoniobacter sp.]|nr:hypothetical protein [Chthoniobacter sp.]
MYDALVSQARSTGLATNLEFYEKRFPHGFHVNSAPLIIEVTPVNFYYVLVFADTEQAVKQSDAMRDEGTVIKVLGGGWVIVQRGFN